MTQEEKFNLLTTEDLQKIDNVIYKLSEGSIWIKHSATFWTYVLKTLQKTE